MGEALLPKSEQPHSYYHFVACAVQKLFRVQKTEAAIVEAPNLLLPVRWHNVHKVLDLWSESIPVRFRYCLVFIFPRHRSRDEEPIQVCERL